MIKVLLRYLDDWSEFYINGKLFYDQELVAKVNLFASLFMEKLIQCGVDFEFRIYKIPYEYNEESGDEYNAPLFSINGGNYWSDWDKAEIIKLESK